MQKLFLSFLGLAALISVPFAFAQQPGEVDQSFLLAADALDKVDVLLGKLAQENGTGEGVKTFAARVVRDHTQMNQDLRLLARRKGLALPQQLAPRDQELIEQLARLRGPQFDFQYARTMVFGHEQAINQFGIEIQGGQDPDLKLWAQRALPVLQEHLRLARDLTK